MSYASQLIPFDVTKAVALFGKRDTITPLPPLYTNPSDATDIPPGLVARTTLNMKPKDIAEHLRLTQHDDA